MKHVFTEVVPLIPYKLNVYYYTGKKSTFLVLIGFHYSCFLPKKLHVKHYNVLWKAVLSQLASSLTCLIQSLLRLISTPFTQTHYPCLLIFCSTGNYSPSDSYEISAALGCSSGCLVRMLIYLSPKHHKLFKTENIPVRSFIQNIRTL